jgi:putative transposase
MMPDLAALSEADRQSALERFRLLQPHLEEDRPLALVARQAGIPYRTAQRWVSLYRRFGLAALARKRRADCGARRSLSPRMQNVVEGLALQKPPLPVAALYRQVCRLAQQAGEKPPCYAVIYDVVRRLPADLVTLAHEGDKAYADAFEMVHRREADRPNAIWQADHTLLDILVIREDGTTAKPWLTVVIDDYSRAIAGYFLFFEAPSALQTALALRQAIWRKDDARWQVCGIPEVLYTDNGSDFTSRHMEQVAADIKMQLLFSTPGRPRGRGRIERFFLTLASAFLPGLPGHASAGGGVCGRPTLTLPELDPLLREFILGTYHLREHGETKSAPKERWERGGFLPRMPESLEQLDLLLLTVVKARKVHPDGIRFQGLRYVDTTLAAYIGEAVTLRYDPRDMAEIRVFHGECFLCRAVCPELAGETIPLRDVLRARGQRRRELRAVLTDRKKTVDALLDLRRGDRQALPSEQQSQEQQSQERSQEQSQGEAPERASPVLRRYINE